MEEHCWFILFHTLAPFLPAKQPILKTSSCWMLAAASTRAGWALFPSPGKWRGPWLHSASPDVYVSHKQSHTFPFLQLALGAAARGPCLLGACDSTVVFLRIPERQRARAGSPLPSGLMLVTAAGRLCPGPSFVFPHLGSHAGPWRGFTSQSGMRASFCTFSQFAALKQCGEDCSLERQGTGLSQAKVQPSNPCLRSTGI